jgi:hypothetical protein
MKTFEYDLRYIAAGVDVLQDYLLSDDVFWPLGGIPPEGEPDYPQLSLGGLLLAKQRLTAYLLAQLQELQVQQVISLLEQFRSKWRVAWERKAGHSFSVRLRMWRDYIKEYRDSPQDNANRYAYEVRLRVMLQLLQAEAEEIKRAEVDLLSGLDGYLKAVLELGDFIWEPEVKAGFPEDDYWYLYGSLSPRGKKH